MINLFINLQVELFSVILLFNKHMPIRVRVGGRGGVFRYFVHIEWWRSLGAGARSGSARGGRSLPRRQRRQGCSAVRRTCSRTQGLQNDFHRSVKNIVVNQHRGKHAYHSIIILSG